MLPIKDENEPISPDEFVLRLIWIDYYDAGLPLPIQPGAFSPKKSETDGISVFRAECLKDPEDVLKVTDIQALNLNIKASKILELAGHAIIPELNINKVKENKTLWRDIQKQLALLASQHVIKKPLEEI